jgi:hypothetical protein
MAEIHNNYKIFDFVIQSDILLPELANSTSTINHLSFSLSSISPSDLQEPVWLHHWLHQNGEKTISVAKSKTNFILRYHLSADFYYSQTEAKIICHPLPDTPKETIRHLLLDQVIPRIVCYLGRPVVHASGSIIRDSGILFLGETGWGKSTLCAFLDKNGFPLLSDDSILLEQANKIVMGIPSYSSLRLLKDSYKALQFDQKANIHTDDVSHYSSKKRVIFTDKRKNPTSPIPIKAIFFLNDPTTLSIKSPLTLSPVTGYLAAIELTKHCFHLDPTDFLMMGKQLQTIAGLLKNKSFYIFNLNYARDHELLPSICKEVTSIVATLP